MGHCIQGIIAEAQLLQPMTNMFPLSRIVLLDADAAIIPLPDDLIDAINASVPLGNDLHEIMARIGDWPFLSRGLVSHIEHLSTEGPVAFIATEYFGGTGEQFAVAWSGGSIAFAPKISKKPGPINKALKVLGVAAKPGIDEFDTVGLQHYRNNESLLEAVKQ